MASTQSSNTPFFLLFSNERNKINRDKPNREKQGCGEEPKPDKAKVMRNRVHVDHGVGLNQHH